MRILFAFAVAGLLCSQGHAGAADTAPQEAAQTIQADHGCTGAAAPVRIRAAAAADAGLACEGARRALDFLLQAGLQLPQESAIDIVDQLPGDLDGRAVGCYVPATRRIVLLSYSAFTATGTWFREPVNAEMYRAAASHEVAHATAACNAESGRLPLAAHEYVAYVAMFASMEPRMRQRVLAHFRGTGFANSLQINMFNYLVDPLQFGADAWRHYLGKRDGAAWLRDMVGGRVVEEWPEDAP